MLGMQCLSCDGWGHASIDIGKGKKGLFSGKKGQCPTQEILDAMINLHADWGKFKEARQRQWPPKESVGKGGNVAVLSNTGNYTNLSHLGKRVGPARMIADEAFERPSQAQLVVFH